MPKERNGIISGYIITVTRRGTDSQLQIMSTTTNITLNRLVSFTSYLVAVAAATSAGLGPPSSQLTFTTDEDGNQLNTSFVMVISQFWHASENTTILMSPMQFQKGLP